MNFGKLADHYIDLFDMATLNFFKKPSKKSEVKKK